jgi:hypothetical protein
MNNNLRNVAALVVVAAAMLPAAPAQAQYYGGAYAQPAPLYPYAVQGERPYAVEVAPNTYEIRQPTNTRSYPYVRDNVRNPAPEPKGPRFDRPHKPADRGLIEELRKRSPAKQTVINTKKIVHDEPVVIETQHVVDDPPRVIERRHVVEDEPVRSRRKHAAPEQRDPDTGISGDDGKARVIQADAEVTILGPDRMSIRLFRKGQGPKAKARAD